MDEIPIADSDQAAQYKKEIQELRWQIQQLQETGNLKDYSGTCAFCVCSQLVEGTGYESW